MNLVKKQHSINIETSLSTNEQLKRRRERREKQRNLALKGEAFYSASHGMTILPAKLDFQQARQLLASKSASSSTNKTTPSALVRSGVVVAMSGIRAGVSLRCNLGNSNVKVVPFPISVSTKI